MAQAADIGADRIQSLLAWKSQLEEELRELRTRRAELNAAIERKEGQANNLLDLLASEGHVVKETSMGSKPANGSMADAAFKFVKDTGQPLYYKDLADRLQESGVKILGRDPHANLLSYIARDHRFQRIGRGTYALTEWGLRPKRKRKSSRGRKQNRAKERRAG